LQVTAASKPGGRGPRPQWRMVHVAPLPRSSTVYWAGYTPYVCNTITQCRLPPPSHSILTVAHFNVKFRVTCVSPPLHLQATPRSTRAVATKARATSSATCKTLAMGRHHARSMPGAPARPAILAAPSPVNPPTTRECLPACEVAVVKTRSDWQRQRPRRQQHLPSSLPAKGR